MSHQNLVSESVASTLSVELVSYVIGRHARQGEDNSSDATENEMELSTRKSIEGLGLLVGLRLSERLLYREATIGGLTPLDVTRFIAQQFWKAAFGKKADRMKHMDNIYFCLIESNFRWLEGFSKLRTERAISTVSTYASGVSEGLENSDESTISPKDRIDNSIGHKDVLVYAVGILRGAIQVMYPNGPVKIHANLNNENETTFVLDFRSAA
ncbi:hypothetical protein DQ04_04251030 [Trypanosoma grayi]|uniref:hypothetical protein n=1 Tax=Trypanosoma grayi TaxID=71804 RepID=UPI0004F4077D|nr:hypothetical protein DQ04_04251030 [Trypanosoma grayi]KEG10048.1 hypothetical protein DQ04_04251030 [Trypanosoma grayi]